jgi:ABC-type nitrate/sulfonate/bicarbonate transport system substrate-binding protein
MKCIEDTKKQRCLLRASMKLMPNALSSSKFGTTAIAIVIGSFVLFLGVARSAGAPVRVAYSAISGAMGPLWVAHDMGIFGRHGLEVQLLYIGGGSVVTQALLGGDVQFVRLGANAVVQASLRGADLKMIANTINRLVFKLCRSRKSNQQRISKAKPSVSRAWAARRILL